MLLLPPQAGLLPAVRCTFGAPNCTGAESGLGFSGGFRDSGCWSLKFEEGSLEVFLGRGSRVFRGSGFRAACLLEYHGPSRNSRKHCSQMTSKMFKALNSLEAIYRALNQW